MNEITTRPLNPIIDSPCLTAELAHLAQISEAEPPIVTRIVFSQADLRARSYVKNLCLQAGLSIREDAIGNTFARWDGLENGLAAVATGSHIDAIPNAGAYDGTVGVLGGLEAIRALQRAGFRPRRPIELVLFTSEEPTRFGIGCLGSRMLAGVLTPDQAQNLSDKQGQSLDELRAAAGFMGDLESVRFQSGSYHAFVELHIEQGLFLEREGLDLGLVTHIAAPASVRILVEGEGGHAGAMLMPQRHDALTAAAELILSVESAALATGTIDSVATVGVCEVFPGAVNSVPSRVHLEIDIRDTEGIRRDQVLAQVEAVAIRLAERRGVRISLETINADPPAKCDSAILNAIEISIRETSLTSRHMVSRAYHDSLFVARFAPVAMIFIPSRGGISHRPDEHSTPGWIRNGVEILARALAKLAE